MEDCIFCKIAKGEFGSEMLFENDRRVAVNDINPQAPVHALIIPKRHIRSINDLTDGDEGLVAEMIYGAKELAKKLNIDKSGYQLFFHVEEGGGQTVFHLHLHLLGGFEA